MASDVVVGDDAVQDGIRGGPLAVGLLGERGVPDVERGQGGEFGDDVSGGLSCSRCPDVRVRRS